jgi:hypothetical protein
MAGKRNTSAWAVGSKAPHTGRYMHSVCANTEVFNKTNVLAPCANRNCKDRGAKWLLIKKLT